MVRGIEQGHIVPDDSDRVEFLRRYLPVHGLEAVHEGRPVGRKQLPEPEQQGSGFGRPGLRLSRRVSGYGTWNQSGNVMEWCSVWHDETDSANTDSGEESLRQERGGCWRYPDKFAFRCMQRIRTRR